MNLPKLIKECNWIQSIAPIKPKADVCLIEKNYILPGLKEAGIMISEALINAKLKKPHRIRVTIQVIAEQIND